MHNIRNSLFPYFLLNCYLYKSYITNFILIKFLYLVSIATVPPTSYVLQLGMIMLPQSHIQACFDVIVATYWKRRSSQEDGDDVSMTLYEFLVDYITDNLYISEIDV